jgi:tyrosyl-tRNA synthetase
MNIDIDNNQKNILENILKNILQNIDYVQGDIKTLFENKTDVNILWGIQPRRLPTIDLLIPIFQVIKFIENGLRVTVLLADIHEMLDSSFLDMNIIKHRCNAYIELIINILEFLNIGAHNINFVLGSEFQTSSAYTLDIYKISALTSIREIFEAREIDKKENDTNNEQMTTLLYPILQALDEKYTDCDIFYGSTSQKNMCLYSEKLMTNFQSKKVVYLLEDFTKDLDINFFDHIEQFENKLNEYSTDYIVYLYRKIFFPLVDRLNDNIIIHNNIINNIDELENKIKNNEINRDKLVEISIFYLSKYILKLYDKLFCTKFMKYSRKN